MLLHSYLALAECAFGAMLDPGGAAEASDAVFICARLGDIVADSVGLARIGDATLAALALRNYGELTVHRGTGERPAVHLTLLKTDTQKRLRNFSTTFYFVTAQYSMYRKSSGSKDLFFL